VLKVLEESYLHSIHLDNIPEVEDVFELLLASSLFMGYLY
jgi:hypothetical protein